MKDQTFFNSPGLRLLVNISKISAQHAFYCGDLHPALRVAAARASPAWPNNCVCDPRLYHWSPRLSIMSCLFNGCYMFMCLSYVSFIAQLLLLWKCVLGGGGGSLRILCACCNTWHKVGLLFEGQLLNWNLPLELCLGQKVLVCSPCCWHSTVGGEPSSASVYYSIPREDGV